MGNADPQFRFIHRVLLIKGREWVIETHESEKGPFWVVTRCRCGQDMTASASRPWGLACCQATPTCGAEPRKVPDKVAALAYELEYDRPHEAITRPPANVASWRVLY